MLPPDFKYEQDLWDKGCGIIAGCDEVGRGCFAGPIVAGAVVFKNRVNPGKIIIRDSKQMSPQTRRISEKWIKEHAYAWGIGLSTVSEINMLGVGKAANKAFRRAIREVNRKLKDHKIGHLLTDAFYIPKLNGLPKTKQSPIIKGDGKSFSIASASIIAKVYRDNLMIGMGSSYEFAKYKWKQNKGYGTKLHREVILQYGITKHHRISFVSTYLSKIQVLNTHHP